MAQVNLDVVYNVKGMQALKQSQTAMNQAANAAKGSTNSVRGYSQALGANGVAANKAAVGNAAASKGFRATGFAATTASGGVKSFGVALSAALGPIAAVTGALALVGKTISVFSERERDAAVLTNGLKNLGLQGTPALDALQRSADKLGKTTLFDQEQFTRGYALLTSFKQIGVSSYERVAKAAADLAQTTGQDLNSALLQLSKALEDPARRVTDLSRSGTVFTEQQKEQIRVLQESGDILGAQAIILGEIEKQYGGAAEAAGSAGFAGAMDSLGEATRDLMEQLGQNLIPILTGVVKVISSIIGFVNTLISKLNELGLNKVFEFLMKPAEIFAGLMGDAAEEVDKTRQNAEGAAPAVADLKDQLLEMPKPVKETADNMEKLAKSTGDASGKTKELKASAEQVVSPTKELAKENALIAQKIQLQKELQAQKNQATGEGVQQTTELATQEGIAAQNAQQLAANQAQATAQIAQSKAEAAQLAANLQQAATASAGIRGGQFAGSSTSANYSSQIYDKYKLDESGNIVQTTADERRRQMNAAKVADANNLDRQVQAWDKAFQGTDYYGNASAVHRYGGMTGVIGSQMHNAYTSMYGNFDDYADYYRRLRPMAEGGYVTGPTNAIVGEGGEPEYVIPASKLDGAMQRYSAGMRGSSMIPDSASVSINYNGSTVDMGGTSYVNKGDVNGIVSQAVNQTLTTLQRSAGARLKAGMR